MKEPNDQHELDSIVELCKVCGNTAKDRTFGFSICNTCKTFLIQYFKSKTTHKQCHKRRQCKINDLSIIECPCCLLRKCINLKLDPYYETRQEINNALRRSFPFYPCPTCISTTSPVPIELNREDYKNTSDDGFRIHSDGKRDDTETESSSLRYLICKVCGGEARAHHYSVLSCYSCSRFFHSQVVTKNAHKPCSGKQQCIITEKNRLVCDCCRLKKCLSVGMDPARVKNVLKIHYESIIACEPMEWFVLLSCETCDIWKIDAINESIQDLKSFFMKKKKKSAVSSAASSKEVTVQFVKKSDVSLYGSNFQVINDHRLNYLSTFTLSSSPAVCERINQVNSSGKTQREKKTDDFESIDMTSFKELIR